MELLRLGLATYRFTSLVSKEAGPFDMFVHFRSWAGVYDIGPDGKPLSFTGKMVECPYCFGIWMAILLTLLPKNRFTKWLILMLAVAGIQTFLQDRTVELS